ncbi:hypothetical protein HMPREF1143_0417 [Peptoanaerobacter stomatis]|uniref:HTH-like domain-containing protein n=1 Tax=Peptoanaerobacter stomatis TaxID=796937 RepID=J6HC98_9FIRM|nr:hypothetical protein HMPREF1143_0417 [Peptoanaerobacter stomatis]
MKKKDKTVSRRKIERIMKSNVLVSNYTVTQYKVIKSKSNEEKVENILDRQFIWKKNIRSMCKWLNICKSRK